MKIRVLIENPAKLFARKVRCFYGVFREGFAHFARWVSKRDCRLVDHRWQPTGVNQWMIVIERRCDHCGAYEHHLLTDRIGGVVYWQPGRHPHAFAGEKKQG